MNEARPWLRFYGRVPETVDYPEATLTEALAATAARVPEAVAWEFFGREATYRELVDEVERCAAGLASLGLKPRDRILVSMPTTPQGVIAFYGAIRAGAVPAMVHPLSTAHEITHYLDQTGARIVVVLDAFYESIAATTPRQPLEHIVVARIPDYLPWLKAVGFRWTKGRKIRPVPRDARVREWRALVDPAIAPAPPSPARPDDPAAILFSGGTTAWPKGILLSHRNFIFEGKSAGAFCGLGAGDSMLAMLPLFHGFGLAICINAVFMMGGKAILVPQFSADIAAEKIRRDRPNVLVGVPTLFEALARNPSLRKADLSCLSICFCGADTLPKDVKERFESLVAERGGHVRLLEGYGLTEAVSGIMATPLEHYREGSIGVPLPGMLATICRPGTIEELPPGEEGEICVSGPAVMLGYLDEPEATAQALRVHGDGRTWLHTGDLGRRDADGFFYFTVRLKRMIKSSGFNVYPAQVEAVLREHAAVEDACVIGVPDPQQVERVVAFVVPRAPATPGPDLERAIIDYCRERMIKWSCPREVGFVDAIPQTKVGKVDFRALAQRYAERHEAKQEAAA